MSQLRKNVLQERIECLNCRDVTAWARKGSLVKPAVRSDGPVV
jgi:hypothetical protein